MTTIRSTHDGDHPHFAIVRPTAQNKALSYEALGMLTYLLSQADDWVIGVDDLIREGCGRDKAYRILKELSETGHLARVRSVAGQHKPPVWGAYVVHEQPFTEMPDLAKPYHEAPVPEKAELVKSSIPNAHAQQQDLKALNTELKDQELKDKDKSTAATTGAREGLPVQSSVAVASPPVPPPPSPRPNIYKLYEDLTGSLPQAIVDTLKLAEKDYPPEWITEAFKEAVEHNARNWAYVRKCLITWRQNGFKALRPATVKGAGLRPALATPAAPSTSLGAPTIRGK